MNKVELNKDIRIKRDENYVVMATIRAVIAERIQSEYREQIQALDGECQDAYETEKQFISDLKAFFKNIGIDTKLKVVVQVGKGSKDLYEYVGHIEKPLGFSDKHFNFISENRDNELKPFTIGFSCLQSVELVEP